MHKQRASSKIATTITRNSSETNGAGLGGILPSGLWDSVQLAAYLSCSERHIFNLRRRGLPSYRVGDIVRFDIGEVTAWLNSKRASSGDESRQSQLRDIATTGDEAAECAAADSFKEFSGKEGK